MFSKVIATASLFAIAASSALAAHTIQVNNRCNEPFKMQFPSGQAEVTASPGATTTYQYDGEVMGQAYVGSSCGDGGEGCTTAQFTLSSSSDSFAAIVAEQFNHPLTVTLDDGSSKSCQTRGCQDAYTDPSQQSGKGLIESNPNSGITLQFC